MIKKFIDNLGLWNRLSLVAILLFVTIFPIYSVLIKDSEWANIGRDSCQHHDVYEDSIKCLELYTFSGADLWGYYKVYLGTAIIFAVVAYLFAFLVIKICRWIWAGRNS